ncbi:hypothetical protein [Sphingomonas sp. R86520]|uniref:hypothetical protein n=1 Tax=Sphingomonas sp. R86520 TaxID=3093859 RepID=UPI0036D350D0
MATQLEDDFTEDAPDLDLDDEQEADAEANDNDQEPDDLDDDSNDQDDDAEEDVVTFGADDVRGEDEPEGIRNLREELKRQKARVRELEGAGAAPVEVGARPKLEDFDYDEDAHGEAVEAWIDKKRNADAQVTARDESIRQAQEKFNTQQRAFEDGWSALRVTGKDAARAKVEDTFDPTQQAMLIKAARGNGAGLMLYLGTSAASLDKLKALVNDPAEFIAEAAVMAKEVKVERRKPATTPIEPVRGGTGGAAKGDARRARLERDADTSGDYSALIKYDRDLEMKRRG